MKLWYAKSTSIESAQVDIINCFAEFEFIYVNDSGKTYKASSAYLLINKLSC